MALLGISLVALLNACQAVKMSSFSQGQAFSQCIKITDFETKTFDDEITLADRDSGTGCCPKYYVPGVKMYKKYVGAQVVCGFKSDGSISYTGSSSSCTYNSCFVWKQGTICADGTKLKINGCCGTTCTNTNFQTGCKSYCYSESSLAHKQATNYCLSYNAKYQMEYTSDAKDDVAGNVLQIDKIYQYTPCPVVQVSGGATTGATVVKMSSFAQGQAFTKCIKIRDFETKTFDDEITVVDRDSGTGCCPKYYVPGVKMYKKYVGAQVVCGFKSDGSISYTGSSSSCTYNSCFVWKQGTTCADGTKLKINGCCGTTCTNANFQTGCKSYCYSESSLAHKQATNYCLSYNAKYKMEYTSDAKDDVAGNVLQINKIYQYTPCTGSVISGGTSGGSTGGSNPVVTTGSTVVTTGSTSGGTGSGTGSSTGSSTGTTTKGYPCQGPKSINAVCVGAYASSCDAASCCPKTCEKYQASWLLAQLAGGGCAEGGNKYFFDLKKLGKTVASESAVKSRCCTVYTSAKCSDWGLTRKCSSTHELVNGGTNNAYRLGQTSPASKISQTDFDSNCCKKKTTVATRTCSNVGAAWLLAQGLGGGCLENGAKSFWDLKKTANVLTQDASNDEIKKQCCTPLSSASCFDWISMSCTDSKAYVKTGNVNTGSAPANSGDNMKITQDSFNAKCCKGAKITCANYGSLAVARTMCDADNAFFDTNKAKNELGDSEKGKSISNLITTDVAKKYCCTSAQKATCKYWASFHSCDVGKVVETNKIVGADEKSNGYTIRLQQKSFKSKCCIAPFKCSEWTADASGSVKSGIISLTGAIFCLFAMIVL